MPIFHIDSAQPVTVHNAIGVAMNRKRLSQRSKEGLQWLRNLARSIARGHDREDIAQQAALQLLGKDPFSVRHPAAYIARIARNVAIDEARKIRVRGGPSVALDDLTEAQQPWSAPDQESALLLKQIVLGLPPLYRDVFILSRFAGLTYGEIAKRLGVSDKTVEYRMSRALALCQEALRD